MIYGQDRQELRQMYADAWRKSLDGQVLSALESQIATVIGDHPEYLPVVTGEQLEAGFSPEDGRTNPFLHMGLHLALRDQLAVDRPPGIRAAFKAVAKRADDRHTAEHRVIECLAETLWEAQRENHMPDEAAYLERVRRL
jgi:hypothetical protein